MNTRTLAAKAVASMGRPLRRIVAFALVSMLLALPVGAQVDPGFLEIFQDGIKVGEIFVPDRLAGDSLYIEHWVLLPNYVSPSRKNGKESVIVPTTNPYAGEADFFERVYFPQGSRYVKVLAHDTADLACP